MFREMRRKEKQMDINEVWQKLDNADHGVLSVMGDDGYPFGVPVSYSVSDEKIIIHGAYKGHKIDAIKVNNKVSFTVVLRDEIVQKDFTTNFESIVAFGKAHIVEDEEEKNKGLFALIQKYSPDFLEEGKKYIERAGKGTSLIAIEIEHITGKRSKR